MASSSPVAVWEWEDDGNLWISYDPFVSTGLERAKQKRAAKIRLKDLTAELSRYVVDFTTMKQIREDTGRERNVRRVVFPATSPAARAVIWEWEDRGLWSAYDNVVGQLLEDHYSRNAFSVVPLHRHTPLPYEVDLSAWRQKNVVTGFSRTVRRRPLSCTYPQVSAETVTSRKQVASASSYKGTKAKVSKSSGLSGAGSRDSSSESAKYPWLAHCTARVITDPKERKEECLICYEHLEDASAYSDAGSPRDSSTVVSMNMCKHTFHKLCLRRLYEHGTKSGFLQCPTCKTIHGVKIGNQPPGQMQVNLLHNPLPGYSNCGTIQISYNIKSGVQGPEHPEPGKRYTANGFPRIAYLPNNADGQKVLKLLKIAWERKLIFTIGSSSTTGERNTVVWNDIHHKTELSGNSNGHGYPDPNYISNVLQELAAHGIIDS
ncbi:probable E3 ubiquitin-protein ligase DTX2 [Oscarella lobularis]|uniref:probable E3 ubiquitin-protein ligase DTX2 n=1 Tax=Oscarella lobularis TaxID=121494 RepID=UPI00331398A4